MINIYICIYNTVHIVNIRRRNFTRKSFIPHIISNAQKRATMIMKIRVALSKNFMWISVGDLDIIDRFLNSINAHLKLVPQSELSMEAEHVKIKFQLLLGGLVSCRSYINHCCCSQYTHTHTHTDIVLKQFC